MHKRIRYFIRLYSSLSSFFFFLPLTMTKQAAPAISRADRISVIKSPDGAADTIIVVGPSAPPIIPTEPEPTSVPALSDRYREKLKVLPQINHVDQLFSGFKYRMIIVIRKEILYYM